MLVLTALLALLLGTYLLRRGWRGRIINDHPWCSSCRFDLVGLGESVTCCPECGQDLTDYGAIRVGQRVRRPRLVAAGLLLIAAPVFTLSALYVGHRAAIDWNRYKPVFWLKAEMSYGSGAAQHTASKELVARATSGSLTEEQLADLVGTLMSQVEQGQPASWIAAQPLYDLDVAGAIPAELRTGLLEWCFALQRDRSKPFPQQLGDIIHRAYLQETISDAEFGRYLEGLIRPRLRMAHTLPLAPGEEATLVIDWDWRGGSGPVEFSIDLPLSRRGRDRDYEQNWFGRAPLHGPGHIRRFVAATEPGTHTLSGKITLSTGTRYLSSGRASSPILASSKRPLSSLPELKTEFPIELKYVVQTEGSTPRSRLEKQVASMFVVSDALVDYGGNPPSASVPLYARPLTDHLTLRFDATWRYGATETAVGQAELKFAGGASSWSLFEGTRMSSGGGSSSRGSAESRFEQINFRAPVPADGPPTGTLILVITELTTDGTPVAPGSLPLVVEIPEVRVVR
ncbi:MAG: hypothetical protein WD749_14215 [Phycisphaerales bacterium]